MIPTLPITRDAGPIPLEAALPGKALRAAAPHAAAEADAFAGVGAKCSPVLTARLCGVEGAGVAELVAAGTRSIVPQPGHLPRLPAALSPTEMFLLHVPH